MTSRSRRIYSLAVVLLLAALACNLRVNRDGESSATPSRPSAQVPTVQILEPTAGAQVARGTTVTVKARAASPTGVRLVELLANNTLVDSQLPELPANSAIPPTFDSLLEYKAEQPGSVTLTVRAYSNEVVGSSSITITVTDALNPGPGGAGTPTRPAQPTATFNPLCRARIKTNLNFRRGPGQEYEIISTFTAGQEPPIRGYADRPNGRWWQVQWGGQIGFISANPQYSDQLGNCGTVGPVVIPPTPSPIPSITPIPTRPGTTATPMPPDLILTQLTGATNVDLGPDGTVQATYIIRLMNVGGRTAEQFTVDVLLPNGQIQSLGLVASLPPGQEIELPAGGLNVTFSAPGVQRLLVTIDPTNTVAESIETNNQSYLDITVNGPAPTQEGTPP